MPKYIEKIEKLTLPVVPLRGTVLFPGIPTSFELSGKGAVAAVSMANETDGLVFVSSLINPADPKSQDNEVYTIGVVAKIKQTLKLPDGNYRILTEGRNRGQAQGFFKQDGFFSAEVISKNVFLDDNGGIETEALVRKVKEKFEEFISFLPKVSNEIVVAVQTIEDPGFLADFICANIVHKIKLKQEIIAQFNPYKRLEKLYIILDDEIEILKTEINIHNKVKEKLDKNQREYYLKEQLKVIQNELSSSDADPDADAYVSDTDEYRAKIKNAGLPKNVCEKLMKEAAKLEKIPFGAAEGTVIRNYLDVCLDIPWNKKTKDKFDIKRAKKILDEDHDGLEKIKERILEFIAVRQLSPELKGQIICLEGPPGVGKSSIAKSVARALNRKFVRISLGGVRDEADIRGHRKTYIASMPGRIINALIQAKSMNPVILLDEVDKMTSNSQGDPSSALLEVLDSDQNKTFRDHFIEVPVDLSDCIFISTANSLDTVSRPLIYRMEVISVDSYTTNEKVAIFQNHLLPAELKRHGLTKRNVDFSDDAVLELIKYYTKEAGVRNLSRETGALCRKIARKMIETGKKSYKVTPELVNELLGSRKYRDEVIAPENKVGIANGLAWTCVGGEILQAEAISVNGSGKVEITGKLGDVMKESAQAAITYVRKNYDKYNINPEFYKNRDIHIHFPEGAVPKDGPSAGVTMVTAIVSELSGIPVRSDVAMTGEITLHGNVLAIGGLREKTMAAYNNGIKTVIIPEENKCDLENIDPSVKEKLNFIPVKNVDQVLNEALVK